VIKVEVTGAPTDTIARDVGRAVVNSNLVKCAVAGCDPNVGRIVGAVGSYLGKIDPAQAAQMTQSMVLKLGGVTIFEDSGMSLDPAKEQVLSDYMYASMLYAEDVPESERNYPAHYKSVEISIAFGGAGAGADAAQWGGSSTVIGSDLTKEYVEVNADYRS
jgi:glutamate N-acetyltransferase/amino-acid N-acetyltransferase